MVRLQMSEHPYTETLAGATPTVKAEEGDAVHDGA